MQVNMQHTDMGAFSLVVNVAELIVVSVTATVIKTTKVLYWIVNTLLFPQDKTLQRSSDLHSYIFLVHSAYDGN